MGLVDWGRVAGSLCLRSWTPGDRYQPAGSASIKKLKDLFQIARIPSWDRPRWPVLADDRAIVWAGRFGTAAEYAAGPESRSVLRIRETVAT
jgi:tRNA(Ile)-lysidine synthase